MKKHKEINNKLGLSLNEIQILLKAIYVAEVESQAGQTMLSAKEKIKKYLLSINVDPEYQ
jgi:hypothetical protein